MSITFNADEIFAMAEEIERNGQKFYRKAAKNISDEDVAQMLINLADMEAEHQEIFAKMKKQFAGTEVKQDVFDPDDEINLYLQAMADGHVFDPKYDAAEMLTGNETIPDILKIAIIAEKDSIVFYVGLKEYVPGNAGKEKIDKIIKEEMSHLATLNQFIEVLS